MAYACKCAQVHFKCFSCSNVPCGNGGLWVPIKVPNIPEKGERIIMDPVTQPVETMRCIISKGVVPYLNMSPVMRNTPRLQIRTERLGLSKAKYESLLQTAVNHDAQDYLALLHIGARDHPRQLIVSEADRQAASTFLYIRAIPKITIPPAETLGMTLMDSETGAIGVTVLKVLKNSSAAKAGLCSGVVLTGVNQISLKGLTSVEATEVLFRQTADASDGKLVLWLHPCTQHHRAARIEPRVLMTSRSLVEASALTLMVRGRELAKNELCVIIVGVPEVAECLINTLHYDPTLRMFEKFGCPQLSVTQYCGVAEDAAELVRLVQISDSLEPLPILLAFRSAKVIVLTHIPVTMAEAVATAAVQFGTPEEHDSD